MTYTREGIDKNHQYVIRCNGNMKYETEHKNKYYDHNRGLWSTLNHATILSLPQANLAIEDLKPWICSICVYEEEVNKLTVEKIMES